jgi:hypothetical protein
MSHTVFMTDNLINSKKNEFKHPRQSREVSRQSTEGIVTHTKAMQSRGTTDRTYALFIEGCNHLQQKMNKTNTQYFLINLSWSKLQNRHPRDLDPFRSRTMSTVFISIISIIY